MAIQHTQIDQNQLVDLDPKDTLERPIRDLRISVIDRCNFRCPYCMPETKFHANYQFLKRQECLSYREIQRIASAAVGLGVTKLRLTGGEPLLDKKIPDLIARLSKLSGVDDFALTTNGMLLAPIATTLADAGLQRVTISLDSLDEGTFRSMSGNRGDLTKVLKGIEAAEKAGLTPIKINVVVQYGVNDHQIIDLLQHFRGSDHIVRLIEFMDVGNRNGWHIDQVVPSKKLYKQIHERWPLRVISRNYPGEVANRYSYLDGQGEIGFISSITDPFCGTCNRARLSADGVLYTCLFATTGVSLRNPLRNGADDAELTDIMATAWLKRADRYSELRGSGVNEKPLANKVEMYRIGG